MQYPRYHVKIPLLPLILQMSFPQLNAGSRLSRLAVRIIQAKSLEEAQGVLASVKGAVMQSNLKRKVQEQMLSDDANSIRSSNPIINSLLKRDVKVQSFKQPDTQTFLAARLAKWQNIRDNLEKMAAADGEVMRAYRERRREFKNKCKKNNYPF